VEFSGRDDLCQLLHVDGFDVDDVYVMLIQREEDSSKSKKD
jgi:hypothetical protein